MTDIFHEVEEDLRNEQYRRLWNRYGPASLAILGVLFSVLVALAIWDNIQDDRRKSQSAAYQALIAAEPQPAPLDRAAKLAEMEDKVSGGYKTIVRLDRAAALVEAEKWDEASALYDEIAADGGVAKPMRDVARLKSALLDAETDSLEDMQARLKTLVEPNAALRFSAGEVLAYVALRTGDLTAARAYCAGILGDPAAPQNLRQRVTDLSAVVTARLEATAAEDGAAGAVPPSDQAQDSMPEAAPAATPSDREGE